MEGEYDPQFNLSGHGQMQMSEVNNPSGLWKQAIDFLKGLCPYVFLHYLV